jgi:hypothetical protein
MAAPLLYTFFSRVRMRENIASMSPPFERKEEFSFRLGWGGGGIRIFIFGLQRVCRTKRQVSKARDSVSGAAAARCLVRQYACSHVLLVAGCSNTSLKIKQVRNCPPNLALVPFTLGFPYILPSWIFSIRNWTCEFYIAHAVYMPM